ncbi:MAG: GntR family transcriptional regulator [Lysobacterales bacterium]|jgi:DNA-binding GntR family transcriptional regulator
MQTNPILLNRPNMADVVAQTLRRMIVDGSLPAGERINEVRIAARLGVSRTPLREALAALAAEGALLQQPRRGFFVRPLSRAELEQIYPIRQLLDPEAMRLTGIPGQARLARLSAGLDEIARAREPEEVLDRNEAWFRELYADCPNRELVELIWQYGRRTSRYEILLMRDPANARRSVQTKRRLLAALQEGDLSAACAQVREIMSFGAAPITAALAGRESASTDGG